MAMNSLSIGEVKIEVKEEPEDDSSNMFRFKVEMYKCHHCELVVDNFWELKRHINSHHLPRRKAKSEHLKRLCTVDTRSSIKQTVKSNTTKFLLCKYCENIFAKEDSLKHHIKTEHTKEECYQCKSCEFNTTERSTFKKHMVTHSDVRPFPCAFCDYRARETKTLKAHIMAKHTNDRPHKCQYCDYRTTKSNTLKVHILKKHSYRQKVIKINKKAAPMLSHDEFECLYCDYKCSEGETLKQHTRETHIKETLGTYKCKFCDYRCPLAKVMRDHTRTYHPNERPRECTHCEYRCKLASMMQAHIKSMHTNQKPHLCLYCDFECVHSRDMKNHMTTQHNTEKRPQVRTYQGPKATSNPQTSSPSDTS